MKWKMNRIRNCFAFTSMNNKRLIQINTEYEPYFRLIKLPLAEMIKATTKKITANFMAVNEKEKAECNYSQTYIRIFICP